MVFGIIQQHQGWIECHSIPGRGTRFDIYLPRHYAPAPAEAAPSVSSPPTGGHETILLVDDESLVRNLGHTILEGFGYRVLLAHDGQDAIDIYQREHRRIDLIILDLTMPRLSGRDALGRLLEINPDARVLFASGYSAEHITEEDHEQVFGFVSKPYRPEDLALAVRNALDRKRSHLTPLPR
jgi:CheY-like chemotaxis protein